ncbi:MAG: glycosyltransferase family 39 protein [Chloroflexi bacterium]|nr:glycosyltransferase family 39 protein [Chloroflexota bacterium]
MCALDPAWKFALGVFMAMRVALSAWAFVVSLLVPVVVQNLDLFGAPTLAVFDVQSSTRYVYSREVDGEVLTFRAGEPGTVVDAQTVSVWSLREGRAVRGVSAGRALNASPYTAEDIFPYRDVSPESNVWLAVWQRFDTNWFLAIAARGYASDGSTVYLPIYPLLIRIVTVLVGNAMLATLLVSNLALIGVLVLFYRLTAQLFDDASACRAVVYLLVFPTGFFLFAAYTESLFLFFTLAAFTFAQRNRWWLASLVAALAALTRLQGVLLIVPLLYLAWRSTQPATRITSYVLHFLPLVLIPLAAATFLAFTNLSLITSYEGELHARFVTPWENVAAMLALFARGQASLVDMLNLFVTIGLVIMTVFVWRRMPRAYGLFVMLMFLAPLFRMTTTQPLVSMTRYALALFPMWMTWGAWGTNPWVNRTVLYLSFPLHLYLVAQFVLWGWVG